MYLIILVLVIALIYAITKILYLKNDIKNISESLDIIKVEDTNKRVVSTSMNKEIINLINDINFIIDENKKSEVNYKNNNEKLKKMITDISHDLRTPLTSIKGYVQYVKGKKLDEEEIFRYLDIIDKKSCMLQEMLDSFFELAKIEDTQYEIKLSKININNILTEVLVAFYDDFRMKNIEPRITLEKSNLYALGNSKCLKRVFTNLTQNILKHNGQNVEISLSRYKEFIMIDFKNDVNDLSQKDVENLFQRFYKADKTRSDKSNGLGLTIAKELVKKMNGDISAELYENKLNIKILLRT